MYDLIPGISVVYRQKTPARRGMRFASYSAVHVEATKPRRGLVWRVVLPVGIAAFLLSLGAANIAVRATWNEVEDGVLWVLSGSDVVARAVAEDSPAARAGVEP